LLFKAIRAERRAEAVKRVWIEEFRLPGDTLIAVGHGKTQFKTPATRFALTRDPPLVCQLE
jgi:hypothetical protein